MGAEISIHRQIAASGQYSDTTDMISMLMGNQDSGQLFRQTIDERKPAPDLFTGKTGINKNGRGAGFHQGTVPF
jgi:hypothetical protein